MNFSNQVEGKNAAADAARQELSLQKPQARFALPFKPAEVGLGKIVCDNMMATAKAVDFLAVEDYLASLR